MPKDDFLSLAQVAEDLSLSKTTVHRWCQEGRLPFIRVGHKYRIPIEPYLKVRASLVQSEDPTSPLLLPLLDDWRQRLLKGARPLSPRTVDGYCYYFRQFVRLVGGAATPSALVNKGSLSRALEAIPVASYSNRYNLFYAVVAFAKFLVERDLLPGRVLEELKPLRPHRYFPARKTVMEGDQIARFLDAIWLTKGNSPYERQLNFAVVKTFLLTGVRNQELCDLELGDADLEKRLLLVKLGKGAKPRQLGVNRELAGVLADYLKVRPEGPSRALFVTEAGAKLTTGLVTRRIKRLAVAAGVDITPHGLRRTWVTQAALKGHSLAVISKACGHSSLSTTQGYLMLSERQVVDSMREW